MVSEQATLLFKDGLIKLRKFLKMLMVLVEFWVHSG